MRNRTNLLFEFTKTYDTANKQLPLEKHCRKIVLSSVIGTQGSIFIGCLYLFVGFISASYYVKSGYFGCMQCDISSFYLLLLILLAWPIVWLIQLILHIFIIILRLLYCCYQFSCHLCPYQFEEDVPLLPTDDKTTKDDPITRDGDDNTV